jgi:hypothetical protein
MGFHQDWKSDPETPSGVFAVIEDGDSLTVTIFKYYEDAEKYINNVRYGFLADTDYVDELPEEDDPNFQEKLDELWDDYIGEDGEYDVRMSPESVLISAKEPEHGK